MAKYQFDIRSMFLLTAVACVFLTFGTMLSAGWLFAALVTALFATFGSALLALFWLVILPMMSEDAEPSSDTELD